MWLGSVEAFLDSRADYDSRLVMDVEASQAPKSGAQELLVQAHPPKGPAN